jgi:serine/threonine-protein kinase RsbW
MLSGLQYRDVVLRSVASACQFVTRRPENPAWSEFRAEVVTAVSEAFNNIVLHGYAGRDDGVIELEIRTRPNHISVKLRDFGASFDLSAIPAPRLEDLPESGLGVYIIRELMDVKYRPGHPNVLILSKDFFPASGASLVEGEA